MLLTRRLYVMKKLIAFLAALSMLTAVGCGSTAEDKHEDTDDDSSVSAAAENKEKNGKEDKEDKEDEEDKGEEASGDSEAGSEGSGGNEGDSITDGMVNDNNCIIDDSVQEEDNDPYDKATLYKMTELAVGQVNTIIEQDKQAYFDSLNIKGLLADKGSKRFYRSILSMGDDLSEAEIQLYYNLISALDGQDDSKLEEIESLYNAGGLTEEDTVDQFYEEVSRIAGSVGVEDVASVCDIYSPFSYMFNDYSGAPEGFADDPSAFRIVPDDSTIYGIEIDSYVNTDHGTFAQLDLIVACGDWEYVLDETNIWISEDQSSVYIGNPSMAENEVKGMSFDEVKKLVEDSKSSKNINVTNSRAKTAYNAVAVYFADQQEAGRDMDTVIDDDDFLLAGYPEAMRLGEVSLQTDIMGKGDMVLLDLYDSGDLPAGKVYVGIAEIEGERTYFVQFKDDTGLIGQFPDPIQADRADSVTWGEFFEG